MQYKTIGSKTIVRIDKGEELISNLTELCKTLDIKSGTITGIGATNNATIGVYNTETYKYHSQTLIGDHEIAPLIGNITWMNDKPFLHLHITLSDHTNKAFSGHLNKAIISATFEGVIDHIETIIKRKKDSKIGLNLLNLDD
jgi:predicted DNA-binding protein with PD1-like motif